MPGSAETDGEACFQDSAAKKKCRIEFAQKRRQCGESIRIPRNVGIWYGAGFKEAVDVLLPGQLSDIAASDHGIHLVQRMA